MKQIILVDIDHTIADAYHRDFMIKDDMCDKDWDDYHAAGDYDKPFLHIVQMVSALVHSGAFEVHWFTARPEKLRDATAVWLIGCGLPIFDESGNSILHMRPLGNLDPSNIVKVNMMKETWPDYKDRVAFIIDDRTDICQAFLKEGIPAMQVHMSLNQRKYTESQPR